MELGWEVWEGVELLMVIYSISFCCVRINEVTSWRKQRFSKNRRGCEKAREFDQFLQAFFEGSRRVFIVSLDHAK